MNLYTRRWHQQSLLLQRGRLSPHLLCSTLVSLVLSLSAAPLSWAAAGDAVLSDTDLLADIAPVTTATRLSQSRVDAPAAITVIDRAMIDASGAQEIVDLFRLVPGFQAYHVNGNKFGVTAHGIGTPYPGQLEVMLDGRSIYLTAFSSPDWRSLGIGINDIERIEIARSPSASSWGANAFQGAVNIITRDPVMSRGSEIVVSGRGHSGRRLELSHFGGWGNSELRLSAGYQDTDGFVDGDEGQYRYLSGRQLFSPTLVDEIELQLGGAVGYGGVGDAPVERLARRDFSSFYQSLTWQRRLENGRLQLRAYHNFLDYEMERVRADELLGIPAPVLAMCGMPSEMLPAQVLAMCSIANEPLPANMEEGSTHRYDIELQHQLSLTPTLRTLWGIGARLDQGHAPLLLNTDKELEAKFERLFGNIEWTPAAQWVWNLGIMVEHSDIASFQTSPRVALNYRLQDNHVLRSSYSVARRTPSLLEANQDTRLVDSNGNLLLWMYNSDPSIGAEENRTLELGYLGLFPRQQLELDLRLFHEEVRNGIGRIRTEFSEPQLIDPPQDLRRFTHTNNATWDSDGLELQLRWQPDASRLLALAYGFLDTHGGVTLGDADDPDDPEADFANAVPKHTLALLGSQRFGHGLTLSGALYHQASTLFLGGSAIDAYTRTDLRLAKAFKAGRSRAEIAAVVQNLGPEYHEFQQRNSFDTRYWLKLSLQLP